MNLCWRCWFWKLGLASSLAMGGALASFGDCALAQITPDGTLGAESSVVKPNVDINQLPSDQIDGGAIRGANLFHSFQEFNIDEGRGAYFTNPAGIENILSRVTGNDASDILGKLGVLGNANLFLINPQGIIFGPNASLDISGSFVGSTASSLNFADRTQFSATAPQATPLLTVSVPLGLQYGGTAGSILNQSQATNSSGEAVGLQVQQGETLALLGGDVSLDGGDLRAPSGRIELGGLAGAGTVGLNVDINNNLHLSFPDGVARADVSLTNGSEVNVRSGGGGSIAVNARNLDILGVSRLRAGIGERLGSVNSQAGDIEISATGAITLANYSLISNAVLPTAVGNSGNINVTARSLSSSDGSQLSASTYGQGDAGSVNINARDAVSFAGVNSNGFSSAAVSLVEERAVGRGGDITITTGSLSVTDGAFLNAGTRGWGDAGDVRIIARDAVSFAGVGRYPPAGGTRVVASGAFSTVDEEAVGRGGNITITARSLSVTDGAGPSATSLGQGDAGGVTIDVHEAVSFKGVGSNGFSSGAYSRVADKAEGQSRSITITAGSLLLADGAQLAASTDGKGDGGNITLNVNILEAVKGGQVLTTSRSSGKAGNITVNATDSVTLSGSDATFFERLAQFGEDAVTGASPASGLFANTSENSTGQGGSLRITTGQLVVQDDAEVNVSSEGLRNAGNLEVAARSIRLDNQAFLSSETTAGQGNIILDSQDLVLRRGSNITADATGTASGGNITIDTDVIAASENSDISANAVESFGGRVIIDAQGIFGTQFREDSTPQSDITASSDLGPQFSGTVEINTPDVDPSQGLVNLPAELVDASGLIASGCGAAGGQGQSEFIITGRGGLPPNPSESLSSDTVWSDLRYHTQSAETRPSSAIATQPTSPTTEQLVEATGWVIDNKGEVVLTATAPTATLHIPWLTPATCHTPEPSS